MEYREIRKMNRADMCFMNVCTFKLLHPRLFIQKAEVEYYDTSTCVRIHYYDGRLGKHLVHRYNFFSPSETADKDSFISLLRDNFPGLTICE